MITILRRILAIGLTIFLLAGCGAVKPARAPVSLRGAWVQGKSLTTQAEIDQLIQQAQQGRLEQIFVGVFGDGRTLYPSVVAEQRTDVAPGFDPLAYIVQEAHARDIQVHAWFAVGRVANGKGESPVIAEHPDWALVGPDGRTTPWLNFSQPAARQFISDMMLETVARGVDGIHFDYTRYPDEEWGFDSYSIETFNAQHDFDLNELRYADLPAYALFEGNALLQPVSARVLARFSNGIPALALNQYGAGQVLLFNWKAGQRKTAVGGEILNRGIESFLQPNRGVYLLRSELTIAEYDSDAFDDTTELLDFLGWDHTVVSSADVAALAPGSVLILPQVYLFTAEEAAQLAGFVRAGGSAVFIDGPTPSMGLDDIRALTGMMPLRKYFSEWLLMTASETHPLLPVSARSDDLASYEKRNQQWYDFREAGINTLIADVYQRARQEAPNVLVTVTITSDQEQARWVNLQNWQAWLEGGYVDALIPRVYEDTPADVQSTLNDWHTAAADSRRLTFALIAYFDDNDDLPKPASQLIEEIRLALQAGSQGFMIFDLNRMSAEQLTALANFRP